jgi:sugar phosphate permease
MKEGLGISGVQAGDLATGNLAGYLVLALFGGFLASRFGPRIVITVSLLLTAFSMLLTGLSRSFPAALTMRIITGLGSGGANVPVMGLISAWFVSRRRGLASGIAVSGSSLGLILTGLIVPTILAQNPEMGWRNAWYFMSAAAFLVTLVGFLFLRNRPADKGLKPYGGEEIASVLSESGKLSSLKWTDIYRTPVLWHLGAIYLFFGFSYIIYTTFFAQYLTVEAGLSAFSAGRIWFAIGVISIVSGFIWGLVSDRIGRKYSLAMVLGIQCLSYLTFGLCKNMTGYTISALLFSLTAWGIPAVMAAATGDIVGARLAPAALGFITLFFGIGQAAGPFTAGRMADFSGTYTGAFALAAVAAFFGAVLSLFIMRKFHR